jgi:hypothetical protein
MAYRWHIVAAWVALALVGCGKDPVPPSVDVTGQWVGPVDSTTGPPSYDPSFGTYQLTLDLVQSGSTVTGSFRSSISLSGTVNGAVTDRTVRLVMQIAPCGGSPFPGSESLEGTVDFTGNSMRVSAQGTACGSPDYLLGTLTRQ